MVKVLLASRHGGHATRTHLVMEVVEEEYEDVEYVVATDQKDDYEYGEKKYRVPSFRSTNSKFYHPVKAFRNLYRSLKIILKEKPDVVVCYGANTSIFLGIISSFTSADLVAVESENRTQVPSMSPKILNFFGAEVWVSYDDILDKYPKENVVNKGLIQRRSYEQYQSDEKEGTLVIPSSTDEELMENHWEYRPHEKLLEEMGETQLVVTRAGMTAYEAVHLAEKVIVRPYEHIHQKNFAEWLDREYDNVEVVKDKTFRELFEEYSEQ
jgi:UDP-N-acetylglucosamine:LPS N-acetylglucosamine transferase